jgi:hypothetical protein
MVLTISDVTYNEIGMIFWSKISADLVVIDSKPNWSDLPKSEESNLKITGTFALRFWQKRSIFRPKIILENAISNGYQ